MTVRKTLVLTVLILSAFTLARPLVGAPQQPDIAILLTDQQHAEAMGGPPGPRTPAMDQLAREGVRFTRAFCATPQCSPSRAALLTGCYPHRVGVMGNVGPADMAGMSPPLDPMISSLGKTFSAGGYETAYFGKWHLGNNPGLHGFATRATQEERRLTGRVLSFLDQRNKAGMQRRPLLIVISWINPHDIYQIVRAERREIPRILDTLVPKSLADDLSRKPFPQRLFLEEDQGKPFRNYREEDWRAYIAFYNSLTEQVDGEIGEVVAALRRQNPSTLIVFSTDHGDLNGAHGLPFKGPAMYEELVRIPMVFSWPGNWRSSVSGALVSNIDVFPTLCETARLRPPAPMDGKSLLPILSRRSQSVSGRDAIFAEYYGKQNWRVPIRMIRTQSWKYVRYLGYGEELYDLDSDLHETDNLAASGRHEDMRRILSERLDRWMAQTKDPFPRLSVTDRAGRIVTPRSTQNR